MSMQPCYYLYMRPAVETPISPEFSDPRISGDLTAVERAATPAPASGAGQTALSQLVLSYLPWTCPWPEHNCHDDFASCHCTAPDA